MEASVLSTKYWLMFLSVTVTLMVLLQGMRLSVKISLLLRHLTFSQLSDSSEVVVLHSIELELVFPIQEYRLRKPSHTVAACCWTITVSEQDQLESSHIIIMQ